MRSEVWVLMHRRYPRGEVLLDIFEDKRKAFDAGLKWVKEDGAEPLVEHDLPLVENDNNTVRIEMIEWFRNNTKKVHRPDYLIIKKWKLNNESSCA